MEDAKFYGLKQDLVFKTVFKGKEELKRLIKETLDIDATDIELKNTELPYHHVKEHGKILDLIVTSKDKKTGKDFVTNIEINCNPSKTTMVRNMIYFFKLMSVSTRESESFLKINKHIQLNFTWGLRNNLGFSAKDKKKLAFHWAEDDTHDKLFSEYAEIVHYNMDYFQKNCYNVNENKFLRWLSVANLEDMNNIAKGDEVMEKINNEVEKLNADEEFRTMVEIENEQELLINSMRIEGLEEGSRQKQIEIARNMLSLNIDINDISKATGLSIAELKELNADEEFRTMASIENEQELLINSMRLEGLEEGHKEEKQAIAKSMLKDNLPLETISKYTGLSAKEIEALIK